MYPTLSPARKVLAWKIMKISVKLIKHVAQRKYYKNSDRDTLIIYPDAERN